MNRQPHSPGLAALDQLLARLQVLEGAMTRLAGETDPLIRELVLAERDTIAGSRRRLRAELLRTGDGIAAADVSPALLRVGQLTIDEAGHEVLVAGDVVELTPTEFALLAQLAREPDRVWTRDELLRDVWGWQDATARAKTRTVGQHAERLRKKLNLGAGWIVAVRGVGYRLRAAAQTPGDRHLEAVA